MQAIPASPPYRRPNCALPSSPSAINQPGGQFGGQAGFGNDVGYSAGGQSGALGYNFSSSDITGPLRDTVTSLGWRWKAALFKL